MKLIDIALKDMRQSFRNAMFLVFGLVLPLLTGALFFFAFGGHCVVDGPKSHALDGPNTLVFQRIQRGLITSASGEAEQRSENQEG